VSKAFTCLSDPEKRQVYDVHGTEQPTSSGFSGMRTRGSGFGGGGGFYDADIDPDEIFRMFFGNNPFGGPGVRVNSFGRFPTGYGAAPAFGQRAQRAPQQGHQPEASAARLLLSLAPFFVIILFNLLTRADKPVST
jgi:DnaJ family protein B protein 12